MSTHKAAGKASQHVSPKGKRLGIKATVGQKVKSGTILVRQRGKKISFAKGVAMGRDFTLYAICSGTVKITKKLGKKIISVAKS